MRALKHMVLPKKTVCLGLDINCLKVVRVPNMNEFGWFLLPSKNAGFLGCPDLRSYLECQSVQSSFLNLIYCARLADYEVITPIPCGNVDCHCF